MSPFSNQVRAVVGRVLELQRVRAVRLIPMLGARPLIQMPAVRRLVVARRRRGEPRRPPVHPRPEERRIRMPGEHPPSEVRRPLEARRPPQELRLQVGHRQRVVRRLLEELPLPEEHLQRVARLVRRVAAGVAFQLAVARKLSSPLA